MADVAGLGVATNHNVLGQLNSAQHDIDSSRGFYFYFLWWEESSRVEWVFTEYSTRLSQVTWLSDRTLLVRVEFPSFQSMAWTLNLKEAASPSNRPITSCLLTSNWLAHTYQRWHMNMTVWPINDDDDDDDDWITFRASLGSPGD